MRRKLNPARTTRTEYPTLEIARKILLAGVLACGVAHADTSVPTTGKTTAANAPNGATNGVRPIGVLAPPQVKGGPVMVQPPMPPGVPPRPIADKAPQKIEKKK